MEHPVRFLLFDGEDIDARFIESRLRGSNIDFLLRHVKTKKDFIKEFDGFHPDIILCDYFLPDYDGFSALLFVRQNNPDVPFIFISSAMNEEMITEVFKRGATDYVSKNNLSRVGFAVKGALRERSIRMQLYTSERRAVMGQLTAGVAHEIKSPIGFIDSNLQTLGQYTPDIIALLRLAGRLKESVMAEDFNQARELASQVSSLEEESNIQFIISDMDNIVRESRQGLDKIKKVVMDLKGFVREKIDVMEPMQVEEVLDGMISIVWNEMKYKADIKKEYGGRTPMVFGNPQKIGQVFVNLLVNAAQAIKEDGVITIRTYTEGKKVCVDISDTGEGIDKKDFQNIFKPFFTTRSADKATGLGLCISCEIVSKYGGDIRVKSQLGRGSTFTVIFPVME